MLERKCELVGIIGEGIKAVAMVRLTEEDTERGFDQGAEIRTSMIKSIDYTLGELKTQNTLYRFDPKGKVEEEREEKVVLQ